MEQYMIKGGNPLVGEVLLLIIVKELLGIDDENNAAGVGPVGFIQTAAGREGPAFCPFVPQGAADVEVVAVDSFVYDEMVGVKVGECVTTTGIFAADEPVFCIGYIDPVREYPLICFIFQEFIGMKLTCFIAFLYVCGKFVSKTDVALGVFTEYLGLCLRLDAGMLQSVLAADIKTVGQQ